MLTLRPTPHALIAALILVLVWLLALPLRANAIPLCAGAASVADLGSEGCTFNNLTFSGFRFSGTTGNPFSPVEMDPADILIDIFETTLAINILERVPGIGLQVTPRDPATWRASGLFSSVSFALEYAVSAAGATFDRYQVTGTGIGGSLRGGRFSASMAVDPGSPVVATGSLGPFLQIGTVTLGSTAIDVRTTGAASQGIAPGGATFISSVRNVFTLGPAPVPAPGTLGLGLLATALLAARRRQCAKRGVS